MPGSPFFTHLKRIIPLERSQETKRRRSRRRKTRRVWCSIQFHASPLIPAQASAARKFDEILLYNHLNYRTRHADILLSRNDRNQSTSPSNEIDTSYESTISSPSKRSYSAVSQKVKRNRIYASLPRKTVKTWWRLIDRNNNLGASITW